MPTTRDELVRFVVNEIDTHPTGVAARAAARFGISRQRVQYHIDALLADGTLNASGNTRARKYALNQKNVVDSLLDLRQAKEEDRVFSELIAPHLDGLPENVFKICNYGFTEMFNNVIDHSMSTSAIVRLSRTPGVLEFTISDSGVGIFRKIKNSLHLEDERHCLLELMKGKLTTDRSRHSGEGIFFTSRAFDHFSIQSGNLYFWHRTDHDDWLLEDREDNLSGTYIRMRICTCAPTELMEVFERFTVEDRDEGTMAFSKTHVPVALAQYGTGNLISRSQAKRVLVRFNQFAEVMLDFSGVSEIGQAFADEIFRVFRFQNPQIHITWINANPRVLMMIRRALAAYQQERDNDQGA